MTPFPDLPPLGELLVDDPLWQYRSGTAAGGGVAHLRVWATKDGTDRRVAVVTETGLGSSVTNSIEYVWASLASGESESDVVLLEHWPQAESLSDDEHVDQVVVADGQPHWRRVWPTESNPNHEALNAWMAANGHEIIH